MLKVDYDIIAIGGGPASFFACIRAAEVNSSLKILILEQAKEVLGKVRVSGGGRCNVTHACFDPIELTQYYPRGQKELLGPFHTFMTGDTMAWFEERGVSLKIEDDNRVFPSSDQSQSIIDCLMKEVEKKGIQIHTQEIVQEVIKNGNDSWEVTTKSSSYVTNKLFVGAGSSKSMWDILLSLGHTIKEPVPSLFTFNIQHALLENLPGLAFKHVEIKILHTKFTSSGPLLITHWGLSGPSVLKLSAIAARYLAEQQYRFEISIHLVPHLSVAQVEEELFVMRKNQPTKSIVKTPLFDIPKRFWAKITSKIDDKNWGDISNEEIQALQRNITDLRFKVNGKSTFKDEFVTCGGVKLKEINFKTYESKIYQNLYFAGEVLDIDAVTGGFNFQACWTGGYIAGTYMASL